MKKNYKIATIVVTYNAYKSGFFPDCLNHLSNVDVKNELYSINHRVFIIDNLSQDETRELVEKDFNQFTLIKSQTNSGYAGGNNQGFKLAMEWGADYIAIVTQDVNVNSDWLLQALKAMEYQSTNNTIKKEVGMVQPLILLSNKDGKINSTGNLTHFLGYGYAGDYLLSKDQYTNQSVKEIVSVSGACFLLSTKALQKVGGFDEEMWMYNEDQDLSWRMQLSSFNTVIQPKSIVYHQYEFSRSIQKMYYMDRNRILVAFQNYHIITLLSLIPLFLLNECASFLFALKGGWIKQKLAVWYYFLSARNWSLLLKKRQLRQSNRLVKDKDIIKSFTGRIDFQDISNPIIKYIANPCLSFFWSCYKYIVFW